MSLRCRIGFHRWEEQCEHGIRRGLGIHYCQQTIRHCKACSAQEVRTTEQRRLICGHPYQTLLWKKQGLPLATLARMQGTPNKTRGMNMKRLAAAMGIGTALALIGYFVGLNTPIVEPSFIHTPGHSAFFHAAIAGVVGVILGFAVKD